jgi:1-acyl-sn-glycerol-3-phosphate acyltransferase
MNEINNVGTNHENNHPDFTRTSHNDNEDNNDASEQVSASAATTSIPTTAVSVKRSFIRDTAKENVENPEADGRDHQVLPTTTTDTKNDDHHQDEDYSNNIAVVISKINETDQAEKRTNSVVCPISLGDTSTGIWDPIFHSLWRAGKVFMDTVSMIPRGQIDINNSDLVFAAWRCMTESFAWGHSSQFRRYKAYQQPIVSQWKRAINNDSGNRTKAPKQEREEIDCVDPPIMVGLSVRTMLDLYLRVRRYPPGSEIIITPALNVPGMIQVLEYHQIRVVGVDLPCGDDSHPRVAVDVHAVETAVSPRTVAILVVHVFGIITACVDDMHRLREIGNNHSIDILEDCAQAFGGLSPSETTSYLGSPHANISFFSFGPIKTTTALGGGIAVFHGHHRHAESLFRQMTRMHDSYPIQNNMKFLGRVVKFGILRNIAASSVLYGLIFGLLHTVLGLNFDRIVTYLIRGFKNETNNTALMLQKIRQKPCPAQLALLCRRFVQSHITAKVVRERKQRFQHLSTFLEQETVLSDHFTIPGTSTEKDNSIRQQNCLWWLYPLMVDVAPDRMAKLLQRNGWDATTGASQLCCISSIKDCPVTNQMIQKILYLPKSDDNHFPDKVVVALRSAIAETKITSKQSTIRRRTQSRSLYAFPAVLLFLPLFWFLVKTPVLISVLSQIFLLALCSCATFAMILWLVRLYMGNYYLTLSTGFAKYSPVIDEILSSSDGAYIHSGRTASNDVLSKMKVLEMIHATKESSSRGSVFLTGCTGFVGSVILRDLLFFRKELQIERVILLCRTRRDMSGKDRVAALLNCNMYSFLPDAEKADLVEVVDGDATLPDAGLDSETIERIRHAHDISHVIHCAATVSFVQSLPTAALSNITSSLIIQSMASKVAKNAKFVYISTAFVHGGLSGSKENPLAEELFSFGRFDPQDIYISMQTTQYLASQAMSELCFPNTYAFSKSVCEHLLLQADPNTLIFRPSIVGPAVQVPYEGWAGNYPSTLIAAACLYLHYQWNLWSFGPHKVPCIPVDVLSRFIITKSFDTAIINTIEPECASDASSDDGFQKVKRCPTSPSDESTTSSQKFFNIYNAAWDADCHNGSCFTWLDFAGAITQVGAVLGYFDRATAYLGLLLASRVLPKLSLSIEQFERLHIWCVRYPFCGLYFIARMVGWKISSFKRLRKFLDLPLLFFPFMHSEFHFSSELNSPSTMCGQRYVVVCVAAAHSFLSNSFEDISKGVCSRSSLSFLSIGGFYHPSHSSFFWSLMQPQGNVLARIAGWILSKVLRRCYSDVTVDIPSFSEISEHPSRKCIVLAPTHRSFFDFLLLSYLFFRIPELQIKMPKIAAADEFKRLPILGLLIQFLGCFFIHRGRMVSDPHLSSTLKNVQEADSTVMEIFIEGTRSRDRRFVRPKTGVLRCLRDAQNEFLIVPISLSYERIAEQEHLSDEAAGERRSNLRVRGIFSWLLVSSFNCFVYFLARFSLILIFIASASDER